MPIYTCTVAQSTFGAETKRALASEIARIHSSMIHVPSTYVNVAFHELAPDDLYAGGVQASSVLVTGWVREGHPAGAVGLGDLLQLTERALCPELVEAVRGLRRPDRPGAILQGERRDQQREEHGHERDAV